MSTTLTKETNVKPRRALKKKAPAKKKRGRTILYPSPKVVVYSNSEDNVMSVAMAKKLLGWTEPEKDGKPFKDYLLKDQNGTTIVCTNVDLQRPYYKAQAMSLMFDILAGNWQFNFESVILGETGLVLDGKHRLIALVLSSQEKDANPETYPDCKDEPVIEILVAAGAKETAALVNTIGTGKPRSIADSFYASNLFTAKEMKESGPRLCRMAQYAFSSLWKRTGAIEHAYTSKPTHADALDFLDRHKYVLSCVRSVFDIDKEHGNLSQLISPGDAAALMYLMASSCKGTDAKAYHTEDYPDESNLLFENQEKTDRFWELLANRDDKVKPVVAVITKLINDGNVAPADRRAVIVKAWNLYSKGKKLTVTNVKPKYKKDTQGYPHLVDDPCIGDGIDIGDTKKKQVA